MKYERNWAAWAANHVSTFWEEGFKATKAETKYELGSWQYEQFMKGYEAGLEPIGPTG